MLLYTRMTIMTEVKGILEDIMDDKDFALIFARDGSIKGIFIPEGDNEASVPGTILELLKLAGIDIHETEHQTIH